MTRKLLLILTLCLNVQMYYVQEFIEVERFLTSKIFNGYDKKLRPADKVEIKFSLYLNQIISLIGQEQVLVINCFLDHEWTDERLQWDPLEYNNITLLRISSELVWT